MIEKLKMKESSCPIDKLDLGTQIVKHVDIFLKIGRDKEVTIPDEILNEVLNLTGLTGSDRNLKKWRDVWNSESDFNNEWSFMSRE